MESILLQPTKVKINHDNKYFMVRALCRTYSCNTLIHTDVQIQIHLKIRTFGLGIVAGWILANFLR